MKKRLLFVGLVLTSVSFFIVSCSKDSFQKQIDRQPLLKDDQAISSANATVPPFNLEVILRGEGTSMGHVKFRQDVADDKIINLDTWVKGLEPNHSYILQRAVDPIN